jgi:hypothetical protein
MVSPSAVLSAEALAKAEARSAKEGGGWVMESSRTASAPKGQDEIAQGNALGNPSQKFHQP